MEVPIDLAVPGPGSTTARRIFGAYLKQTAKVLLALPLTRFDSRVADDFTEVREILERQLRAGNPGPLYAILRKPTLSTLVRCIERELWDGGDVERLDAWLTELTGLFALELAALGLVPEHGFVLNRRPARFLSIASGMELELLPEWRVGFQPGTLVMTRGAEELRLSLSSIEEGFSDAVPGARLRRAFVPVSDAFYLALADNNPLSNVEAHPDKRGNALDLGGRTETEWVHALSEAFAMVEGHLPELAEEMRLVLQLVVPVGEDAERHLSASYAEAIGTAYLSLHPDPMTMAEALIHEFSHNKINALMWLDPVLENAHEPLFSSPVRPDPRPLHGVLLAVHAFVPVARLYEKMKEGGDSRALSADFARRAERIVEQNREGTATLRAHAEPTAVGRGVLDELYRWDEHYARGV